MSSLSRWSRDGLRVDDLVIVDYGRWRGREGSLLGWHYNPGGMRQQAQSYPVVELLPVGRAKKRTVRVLSVTKCPA